MNRVGAGSVARGRAKGHILAHECNLSPRPSRPAPHRGQPPCPSPTGKRRMIMAAPDYRFRPMAPADLPLVLRWLQTPHVMQWWGEAYREFELIRGDFEIEGMDQFIVCVWDRPFGYLQCYEPTRWPENGLGRHPPGTRGIDQFIGETDMIGRGHGSAFIRAFIERLLRAGAPRIITDPDPANVRAIRAYEKAGFYKDREVDTPDGRALLMVRNA